MLSALLIACALLSSASCGPSPTAPGVAVSEESRLLQPATSDVSHSTAGAQAGVTMAQVIAKLSGFYQATARAATEEPLAEMAQTLASIQTSVAAVSGRLDLMYDSQLQLQKVQTSLAKRLDGIERSQTEASSRLETMSQSQTETSSRLQSIEQSQGQVFSRFDGITQSQTEASSRLQGIEQSQGQVSSRLDGITQSQTEASSRLQGIEQSQSQVSSRLDGMTQSQTEASSRLDTIQSTLSRLDGMQQLQNETASQLDTVHKTLSARFDAVEASHGALSSRIDTVLQQQTAAANRPAAVCEQLDAIQAAVSRIPKTVLGEACHSDTYCSRTLPKATCGSAGLCSCRDGYRQVSDTVCRKHSRLSEPCLEVSDCQGLVSHAVCASGACGCTGGFWNYNNAECRQVSAVNMGDSCVGDQDCVSSFQCVSGTCCYLSRTIGGYEYRLAGGPSCNEGRVELRRPGGASWGLVCDDGWDDGHSEKRGSRNAIVVCRSLGFRSGVPVIGSQYGRGTNYYMDNVKCSGSESHLMSCPYNGWGRHDCDSSEVVGVRCQH